MDARPIPGSRPARLTIPSVEGGPRLGRIGPGGTASNGGAAFGLRQGAR